MQIFFLFLAVYVNTALPNLPRTNLLRKKEEDDNNGQEEYVFAVGVTSKV